MKRFNSQSTDRKIKRGHLRFMMLPFVKNSDGTNKVVMQRKTTRGKWLSFQGVINTK